MFPRQKAFDKAIRGIRRQNSSAFFSGGCKYRTRDGARCAVGWLLLEDSKFFDAADYLSGLIQSKPAILEEIARELGCTAEDVRSAADFLYALQDLHDSVAEQYTAEEFMPVFLDRARSFAKAQALDPAVIDE